MFAKTDDDDSDVESVRVLKCSSTDKSCSFTKIVSHPVQPTTTLPLIVSCSNCLDAVSFGKFSSVVFPDYVSLCTV